MMVGAWWMMLVLWCPAFLRGHPCLDCETFVPDSLIPEPSQMLAEERNSGRGAGDVCSARAPCPPGLACHYLAALDTNGVCREIKGVPCVVFNETYQNGETFMLDCRTQCSCQEGRYACTTLCPKESIVPLESSCRHPRLVEVPGHCCREWMCDSHSAEQPPECGVGRWSSCSSECGTGLSRRSPAGGTGAAVCGGEEVRLCQHRPCPGPTSPAHLSRRHRLRKGHQCKATLRQTTGGGGGLRLLFASCLSRRTYRPKECGSCPGHVCRPELSISLAIPVLCREPGDSLEDSTLGAELWSSRALTPAYSHPLTVSVEWITKCECSPTASSSSLSGGLTTRLPELLLHRVHRTTAP